MQEFSVSMCVYGKDNAVHFKLAVDSILNQTVRPSEIVLVVDGPVPDELNGIIEYYKETPIFKVIRLEKNQGHGIARRIGLENCTYDLVALMDADDISLQNRFEIQLEMFKNNPELDIVGGNETVFMDDPNEIIGKKNVFENDKEIKSCMKRLCPMNQVTVMFKKNSVQSVGGYQDWYCNEDYYLWIRMALAEMKFANVPEVLVNVRFGNGQSSRRGSLKYFVSGAKLQWFMFQKKIISFPRFIYNTALRFCFQVLMTNRMRSLVTKMLRK